MRRDNVKQLLFLQCLSAGTNPEFQSKRSRETAVSRARLGPSSTQWWSLYRHVFTIGELRLYTIPASHSDAYYTHKIDFVSDENSRQLRFLSQ